MQNLYFDNRGDKQLPPLQPQLENGFLRPQRSNPSDLPPPAANQRQPGFSGRGYKRVDLNPIGRRLQTQRSLRVFRRDGFRLVERLRCFHSIELKRMAQPLYLQREYYRRASHQPQNHFTIRCPLYLPYNLPDHNFR